MRLYKTSGSMTEPMAGEAVVDELLFFSGIMRQWITAPDVEEQSEAGRFIAVCLSVSTSKVISFG